MAISVVDTLTGLNSALGYGSPNPGQAESVAQGTTGNTNANSVAGGPQSFADTPNVYVAGGMVIAAIVCIWLGGGVIFKGM